MRCTRRASSRSRSHASSTWKPSPQWKNYGDHKRLKLTNSLRVFRGRKTPHSKTVVRATVPRVRIPPPPPFSPVRAVSPAQASLAKARKRGLHGPAAGTPEGAQYTDGSRSSGEEKP